MVQSPQVGRSDQGLPLQYTVTKAAHLLDLSVRTVERLIAAGELACIGKGKIRRIAHVDILDWQARNRSKVGHGDRNT